MLLLLETIKSHAGVKMHADNVRDTLSRTGPGAFTQAVLSTAMSHSARKVRLTFGSSWHGMKSAGNSSGRLSYRQATHALTVAHVLQGDPFPVRILPRVCGGWHSPEIQIVQPAFIIHKFAGSW